MNSLFETLASQIGGQNLDAISSKLGADRNATEKAISGALPVLLGALAKNAGNSGGLSSLTAALDRDHDGSVLDDLGGFLGNEQVQQKQGGGILEHVLGGRQATVAGAVSQTSGLDAASTQKLLMMLAPLVMGALGKAKRERGLDSGGLADLLGGERRQLEQRKPDLGILGSLLDQDGDGSVLDDVASAGAGLLGKFLGKR
jgi:hypothetical protein